MMTRCQRILALLAVTVLLTGCQRPSLSWPWAKAQPAAPAQVTAPPATPAPQVSEVTAASLYFASDRHLSYAVTDQGKPEVRIDEEWVREGNRLVAAGGGVPYAVWEFRDDGVWRLDPRGGGALLRYLPPLLQDGAAWRQTSGRGDVWFWLARSPGGCQKVKVAGDSAECWRLQVLNQGELTTFLLASGLGPVQAEAVNFTHPADSFVKTLVLQQTGTLAAPARKAILDKEGPGTAAPAPVVPATPAEFQQALPKSGG